MQIMLTVRAFLKWSNLLFFELLQDIATNDPVGIAVLMNYEKPSYEPSRYSNSVDEVVLNESGSICEFQAGTKGIEFGK